MLSYANSSQDHTYSMQVLDAGGQTLHHITSLFVTLGVGVQVAVVAKRNISLCETYMSSLNVLEVHRRLRKIRQLTSDISSGPSAQSGHPKMR